jgi:hypothetical protein
VLLHLSQPKSKILHHSMENNDYSFLIFVVVCIFHSVLLLLWTNLNEINPMIGKCTPDGTFSPTLSRKAKDRIVICVFSQLLWLHMSISSNHTWDLWMLNRSKSPYLIVKLTVSVPAINISHMVIGTVSTVN